MAANQTTRIIHACNLDWVRDQQESQCELSRRRVAEFQKPLF